MILEEANVIYSFDLPCPEVLKQYGYPNEIFYTCVQIDTRSSPVKVTCFKKYLVWWGVPHDLLVLLNHWNSKNNITGNVLRFFFC